MVTSKKVRRNKSNKKRSFMHIIATKLDDLIFSRPCKKSNLKKFLNRKGPPIPAYSCRLNTVKKGNDGFNWKVIESGKTRKWIKQKL